MLFEPLRTALPPSLPRIIQSYPTCQPLSYGKLMPLVQKNLPTDRPFVILGESFSGPLALMLAVAKPPGLRGVILCASFVRNPHAYFPGCCAGLIRSPLLWLYPLYARCKALLCKRSSPWAQALGAAAMAQVRPAVIAHRIRSVIRVDARQALAACPVPIIYLRGTLDYVVPRWNLVQIRKLRPDVQVVDIEAPHMVLQTKPEEAARAIVAFCQSA